MCNVFSVVQAENSNYTRKLEGTYPITLVL